MSTELTITEAVQRANTSEIARRVGLTVSAVSRILNGKRNPRADHLLAIAAVMDVSVDDLYIFLLTKQGRRRFVTKARAEAEDRGRTPVFSAPTAA